MDLADATCSLHYSTELAGYRALIDLLGILLR